jgi:hypothetical protein
MSNRKKLYVSNSFLILVAFSSVFYSRILATTIRFSLLNIAHFGLIPTVCIIALFTTNTKDYKQTKLSWLLLSGLLFLLSVALASALWNDAGIINAVVSFMMLGEPFMFLLAISCVPLTLSSLTQFKYFLYGSVLINFLLAALQKPLIDSGRLYAEGFNGTDGCGGVFFVSGAGNYVSATVSLMFALYLLGKRKSIPLWLKYGTLLLAVWHILFSDSKQLVLTFGVAWFILILISSQQIVRTIKLSAGFILVGFIGLWCVQNIPAFSAFTSWARPELYGPDGLAWYAKFFSIHLIWDHFTSPVNWLLGLGPGHTVSRLGAWFIKDYASILSPLGSTGTTIGQESRDFVTGFWLTSGSSLFSPIFSWAGVWGDLGFLGIGAYLFLGFITWQYFGSNDSLKTILLSVFVIGFIFTQMEEPGYMISIAFLLGVDWQEKRLENISKSQNLDVPGRIKQYKQQLLAD